MFSPLPNMQCSGVIKLLRKIFVKLSNFLKEAFVCRKNTLETLIVSWNLIVNMVCIVMYVVCYFVIVHYWYCKWPKANIVCWYANKHWIELNCYSSKLLSEANNAFFFITMCHMNSTLTPTWNVSVGITGR